MHFLTNEHIIDVLDMKSCLEALEDVYHEMEEQHAAFRPRMDFYVPQDPHYYRWGTVEGASRRLGVFAIRMKSDMMVWNQEGTYQTEDKYCMQPGTYCGLIFLYSVKNGEPLALMNDGYLQHMRVGACAGLGVKYLSRQNSRSLAMIGSGNMARTYAMAICEVRPIQQIRVFSPTKVNRDKYAREMSEKLQINVEPADAPETAIRGADIVAMTTDSLVPVIKADWIEPGMHVTNVRKEEAGPDVYKIVDMVARLGTSAFVLKDPPPNVIQGNGEIFATFAGTAEERRKVPPAPERGSENPNRGTFSDIIAGRWAGRTNDRQITFVNNQGTGGLHFAALSYKAHELAKAKGLGHQLPLEWFIQNIRD